MNDAPIDWEQRALDAESAIKEHYTYIQVLEAELKRVYDDHFSEPDCRCRECHNRIKDVLNL